MDPYSYQPMVTVTVPMYRDSRFYGVSTIDLKLEGLQAFLADVSQAFGGYAFAVDRNGKFLSFPREGLGKRYGTDVQGNRTEEMRRLPGSGYRRKMLTATVGGVPMDSAYIVFIIDTSGSMQENVWLLVLKKITEVLDIYPAEYRLDKPAVLFDLALVHCHRMQGTGMPN